MIHLAPKSKQHFHIYNNSLELTKLLLAFNWTYIYILPLQADELLLWVKFHYFDKKSRLATFQINILPLSANLPIPLFTLGLTIIISKLSPIVESILFYQNCLYPIWSLLLGIDLRECKKLCYQQLQQSTDNRIYQWMLSKHLKIHIFVCISHKTHTLEL